MPSKHFLFSSIALTLILLSATVRAQTAQAPDPTAGMAPAAKAQAPSAQVDVTYVNSQLTITADGAPLIEVLRAACKKIGAQLDAHAQPRDPVSATLGPGFAKDVLETLLSDAHVNYVLGAKADDPNAIANVTISPQAEDTSARSQATHEQTGEMQDNSTAAPPVKSGASQLLELFDSAKGELANGASLDFQSGGDGVGSGSGEGHLDVATIMKQIEAQAKATESASSSSQNQQADSATLENAGNQSNIVNPTHRPMHRKHH